MEMPTHSPDNELAERSEDKDLLQHVNLLTNPTADHERDALVTINPVGFHLRPPLPPHRQTSSLTSENDLFQTIHMGAAVVDTSKWKLVIDGLVNQPFSISWSQLLLLPKISITSFHECYGSPIKPPVTNLWRIGNVSWSGVPLDLLLRLAQPKPEARYVWSDGLDSGSFGKVKNADRYQKDMPLTKAVSGHVIVAYEMNGESLGKERGGPVRLVVPGWYGTNSTKWLCRLSLQEKRSMGPFTTTYYNEVDPTDLHGCKMKPCWDVEPNSFLLTMPAEEGQIQGPDVVVSGRAWSSTGIRKVAVNVLENDVWVEKDSVMLGSRLDHAWQYFETKIRLKSGRYRIMARATDLAGISQPISGRRNHVHQIEIAVV